MFDLQNTAARDRRKRKRRPTLMPRFGPDSLAEEIALVRLSLEVERELLQEEVTRLRQEREKLPS
jgi:hypothetical protein